MCIIVVKLKGSDFPSDKIIKQCMKANPDGFGLAWNENGKVRSYKTMDEKEMLRQWHYVASLDKETTGAMLHARIATHGSKKLENCHCWIEDDMAFAHNGILSNVFVHDDMTDSECFFRDIVLPIYRAANKTYKGRRDKDGKRLASLVPGRAIAALAGSSRLAFLNGNGDFSLFGDFVRDTEEGKKGPVYYSNRSYINYSDYTRQFGGVFSTPYQHKNATVRPAPSIKQTLKIIGEGETRIKQLTDN